MPAVVVAVLVTGTVGSGMVGGGIGLSDHHPSAVPSDQDLDGGSIQRTQRLGGDHVFGGSAHHLPLGHIDHAVEGRGDRIDVVGHDQHGDPRRLADVGDQRRHRPLVR